MKEFSVQIIGLPKKKHHYAFSFGEAFFAHYGADLIKKGQFSANVTLDVKDIFIQAHFQIEGKTELICDRTTDPFEYPIDVQRDIVFKYGEEELEVSEDMMVIPWNKEVLDIGQYIYEFIALSIPAKKLHPRERKDDIGDEVIYASGEGTEKEADPRWEALKSLTKTN